MGKVYVVYRILDKATFKSLYSYYRWIIRDNDGYFSDQCSREMHDQIVGQWWENEETMYRLLEYFGV